MIIIKITGSAEIEMKTVAKYLQDEREQEHMLKGIIKRSMDSDIRSMMFEAIMNLYKKHNNSLLDYAEFQHQLLPDGLEVNVVAYRDGKQFIITMSNDDMKALRDNSYEVDQDPEKEFTDAQLVKFEFTSIMQFDGRFGELLTLPTLEVEEVPVEE